MDAPPLRRVEPAAATVNAARAWLRPVRDALGADFLAAYLTGSVLTTDFDPKRSRVNLLVIARALGSLQLDALGPVIPDVKTPPAIEPLFLARPQIERSLDVFPIEWIDIQERHLLLEGEDVVASLDVPRTYLRLQCEHELRGKHIQLRQAMLRFHGEAEGQQRALSAASSGFVVLFRTLLRLNGETPPAETGDVIVRVAEVYSLDREALLSAHFARTGGDARRAEAPALMRRFVAEVDRLIAAIDTQRVP